VKERLCLLTVHAHPDDEASKGAPTMAMYKAEGVHTVLVCCTGGEEGDLQNPALREPGQPFHGLSADEEKRRLAELRPDELLRSAEIIGFDEVVMLGYRDSGMVDTDPNHHPESFNQAPIDEAVAAWWQSLPSGRCDHHLRRRPERLPASRSSQGHDISILAGERRATRRGIRARRALPAAEAHYSVGQGRLTAIHQAMIDLRGESPYDKDWPTARSRPSHHHAADVGNFLWARSGACVRATQVDPKEPWWFD
jgi:mycothiol S-conjugate amidase